MNIPAERQGPGARHGAATIGMLLGKGGPMGELRARVLRAVMLASAAGVAALAVPAVAPLPSVAAAARPHLATLHGEAFDECGLPSIADLKAWSASPYKALNLYIGGVNEGCPQHMTASWVRSATSLGWALIPTYVGLQAPNPECPCYSIIPSKATAEGEAAAAQAVGELKKMGVPAGNVVYDDMEGYTTGPPNTPAVMNFLSGWTRKLHAEGYVSGVYAGAATGISDLVSRYGTGYAEPDDIWIADWNGQRTVSDPHVPAADWSNHQRLHQYSGGVDKTYGGVTINIDGDFCDGAVVAASSL
jgi:hypothetical protein